MARVRLFAAVRELAGKGTDEIDAPSVGLLIEEAKRRYGTRFADALASCSVAVNGTLISSLASDETTIGPDDEVAFLPPVSGGSSSRIRPCEPGAIDHQPRSKDGL